MRMHPSFLIQPPKIIWILFLVIVVFFSSCSFRKNLVQSNPDPTRSNSDSIQSSTTFPSTILPTNQIPPQKRWEGEKQELDRLYDTGNYEEGVVLAEELYRFSQSKFGDRDPNVLTSINDLGKLYFYQGLYNKVEFVVGQRDLALRGKSLKEKHPKTLAKMNSLDLLYHYQDLHKRSKTFFQKSDLLFQKVEPLFQKALLLRKEILGEKHPDTLDSMNELGLLYYIQGLGDKAESILQKSLELRREVLGKKHPDTLRSMDNLAFLYLDQGFHEKLESLAVKGLELRREVLGEKHPETLRNMANLGELYLALDRYEEAEPLLQKSLLLREKILDKENLDLLNSMHHLGILYSQQGIYKKAELLVQKSLIVKTKVLGERHPFIREGMRSLGAIYNYQGVYEKAEPLLQKALALNMEILGEQHPETLFSMASLGNLYYSQGLYDKAEFLYQKILKLKKETLKGKSFTTLNTMGALGELYVSQGDHEKAEPLLRKTLVLMNEAWGEKNRYTLYSMNILGALYMSQGLYSKAESLFQKSLAIITETLGEQHSERLGIMNNLGVLYNSQGLYDKAETFFQETLALRLQVLGKHHPDSLRSINHLARLYLFQGSYKQASSLLFQSLRESNSFLEQVLWGASKKTRQSYLRNEESMRDVFLSFYHQNPRADSAHEALYFSLTRKGMLLKVASEIKRLVRSQGNPQVQQLAKGLSDKKQEYGNLIFLDQVKSLNDFQKRSRQLKEKIEELEAEMGRKVQAIQRAKQGVTPLQVIQALTKEQLLIDFLVFQEVNFKSDQIQKKRLMAIVVDSTQFPSIQIVDLGELAPILKAIEEYRNHVYNFLDEQTLFQDHIQELSRLLWHPFLPYLKGKEEIFFVPDGPLHLLPFATLKNSEGKYLVEEYKITILSSTRDLVLDPLRGEVQNPMIVSAPDYFLDSSSYSENCETRSNRGTFQELYFCSLPGAREEGEQLNRMMSQVSLRPRFYQGAKATEEMITQVSSPKYLHFATHGYFLDEVSFKGKFSFVERGESEEDLLLRSGLAMAGANQTLRKKKLGEKTDGILTALEILGLNLEGTELVVMSACDTGVGKIQQGEGVYSLQRAFQEAGAKAVLSTLWKLHDEGTQDFMKHFYTWLLQGSSAQEALRKTQLAFIQRGKYQNHPYFWAPFTLIGKEH